MRFAGEELTYEELNRRANRLAHRLRAIGVRAEDRVGIAVERSLDMVVGVLAILKAGARTCRSTSATHRERLAFILEDARASVIVTQRRFATHLPASGPPVVYLDGDCSIAGEAEAASSHGARRGEPCLRRLHVRINR